MDLPRLRGRERAICEPVPLQAVARVGNWHRRDHPMTFQPALCPDTDEPRLECACSACCEFRDALAELRRDQEEEDWRRSEQSRRIDSEYVRRRM